MILETERLILRPFTESDAADAFEYLHEPMVHCFACMKTETMEDARKAVLDRAKDGEYYFAITLMETGKVIGEIDAMPETHAPDEENAVLDTFSPCWMLNPAYHGKGYAYEAAHAFFDYLFNKKGGTSHLCLYRGLQRGKSEALRKARHAPRGAVYGVRELCKGRERQSHIREYVSVCDTEKGMGAEQQIRI